MSQSNRIAGLQPFQLQWGVLVLLLAVAGWLTAADLYAEHGKLAENEQRQMSVRARVLAENLEQQLSRINEALLDVQQSHSHWADAAAQMRMAQRLKAINQVLPSVASISILDAHGLLVATSRPGDAATDLSRMAAFREARQDPYADTLYVSQSLAKDPGGEGIYFSRVLLDARGGLDGVVIATLDSLRFRKLIESLYSAPGNWEGTFHGADTPAPAAGGAAGPGTSGLAAFTPTAASQANRARVFIGTLDLNDEARLRARHFVRPGGIELNRPLIVAISRDIGQVFQPWFGEIMLHGGMFGLFTLTSVFGLLGYQRNQKRLEQFSLKAISDRWQFAIESHGDAMWDWNVAKGEIFLTEAARSMFGMPAAVSRISMDVLMERVIELDRHILRTQVADIEAGKISEWSCELRVFCGTEEGEAWIAFRGGVMTRTPQGKPLHVICIGRNVTLQKKLHDDTRRQKQLMAHQGRLLLLGEMASALAHEINQPLTAIGGFAAACARKSGENAEVRELARAIEDQAIRAGEIAWRMRGFARRQGSGRSAIALHEVAEDVKRWIYMDTAPLVISIELDIREDLPRVWADRIELEQVLVNLVRNGIEASDQDKPIRIVIAANNDQVEGRVEVSVTDWGSGLPDGIDVFMPFATSKPEGLGLGLSICYSIVESHGSHLWAKANPEGGMVFQFDLPVEDWVLQT